MHSLDLQIGLNMIYFEYKMRSGLFFIMNMDIIAITYDLIDLLFWLFILL